MDDPRFVKLCEQLIPATLRACATDHAGTDWAASATALMNKPVLDLDLRQLSEWAWEHDCDFAGGTFDDLISIGAAPALLWAAGRELADELVWEGFEESLLILLRWMHEATPEGNALSKPAMVTIAKSNEPSGMRFGSARLHPDVAPILDEYKWFWSRYVKARLDSGQIENVATELPDDISGLMFSTTRAHELPYALGMLAGMLHERGRQGPLEHGLQRVLDEIKAGNDTNQRLHNNAYLLQVGIGERVNESVRFSADTNARVRALDDLFTSAVENLDARVAAFDAHALTAAREGLLTAWRESHTEAQQAEASAAAKRLVGDAAWNKLSPQTQDDLRLYLDVTSRDRHVNVAVILLSIALERELGAALGRLGISTAEMGHDLRQKLGAAVKTGEKRLAPIAKDLRNRGVVTIRNSPSHGDEGRRSDLSTLQDLLLPGPNQQHGALGLLVGIGRTADD